MSTCGPSTSGRSSTDTGRHSRRHPRRSSRSRRRRTTEDPTAMGTRRRCRRSGSRSPPVDHLLRRLQSVSAASGCPVGRELSRSGPVRRP
jgi:hypothetical protein